LAHQGTQGRRAFQVQPVLRVSKAQRDQWVKPVLRDLLAPVVPGAPKEIQEPVVRLEPVVLRAVEVREASRVSLVLEEAQERGAREVHAVPVVLEVRLV